MQQRDPVQSFAAPCRRPVERVMDLEIAFAVAVFSHGLIFCFRLG
jgi:hypothetical protein